MKKQIAGICAFALFSSAMAFDNPTVLPDAVVTVFSPDNKACVSEMMNSVFFFDLNDIMNPRIFSESEDGLIGYSVGSGNFISNQTVLVFRAQEGASAWCWSPEGSILNGRWRTMNPSSFNSGMGMPNATTADGSRACGNMSGGGQFGQEDVTYVTPCVWDFSGTAFSRTPLDHPATDYAGLAPQYVTALAISDDGKTVIGQVVSNNGFLCEYVVYKQDANGLWSYVKPFDDLVNPNNIVLPPYPGDGPAIPSPETYFSDAEKAAFDKAMEAYQNGQGAEPDAADFLLEPAGIAAYNKAVDEYNAWAKKINEYNEVNRQILRESITFVFNQGAISPNGRYFVTSSSKTYVDNTDGSFVDIYEPVLYDLEEMKLIDIPTTFPGDPSSPLSLLVTGVSNNGDIIGYERISDIEYGYFLKNGAAQWMPLEDYIIERNPSLADWIQQNWKHTVEIVVDEEEGITDFVDMIITGVPFISRDFSMLSTVTYAFWTDGDEALYNRYLSTIIKLDEPASAIDELTAASSSSEDEFYDLQGRRVLNPTRGLYIGNGKKILCR